MLFLFLSLGAWALSSPIGSSPDDDYHLPSIWCSTSGSHAPCSKNGNQYSTPGGVANSSRCYAFDPYKTAECVDPILSGPPTVETYINNNLNWYPPFFYKAMHFFVSKNIQTSVLIMRLFNSFLFVALFGWSLYLFRRSKLMKNFNLLFPILLIPLGFFIIPSTNPSSWSVTGGFFAWLGLSSLLSATDHSDVRSSLWFCTVTTGIFLSARADSGGFLILITSAILIQHRLMWKHWRPIQRLFLFVIYLISFMNLFSYMGVSVIQQGLSDDSNKLLPHRNPYVLLIGNLVKYPELIIGNFGYKGLGWLDTTPPVIVPLIVFGLVIWLYSRYFDVKITFSWSFVALGMLIIPLYVLQKGNNTVGEHVQPRYLLPLIPTVLGLMLTKSDYRFQSTFSKLTLTSLATVAYGVSLYTNISRYSVGIGGFFLSGRTKWHWPGVSATLILVIGLTSFYLFLIGLHSLEKEI